MDLSLDVITVRDGRLRCDSEEVDIESEDEQDDRINYTQLKKSRRPPKTAILRLKVIFNKGWVESSKGGCRRRCVKYARKQAKKLVNETEYIFSRKYSEKNRLPTTFKIEIEKGAVSLNHIYIIWAIFYVILDILEFRIKTFFEFNI